MKINKLLKILLYVLPWLEITVFIVVGSWIGVLPTLLLVVLGTILGLVILRLQGFLSLLNMRKSMGNGSTATFDAIDNTIMMLGALLLIIPGFITDIIGLLLLIPMIRSLILRWLVKIGKLTPGGGGGNIHGVIVEGEYHSVGENHD